MTIRPQGNHRIGQSSEQLAQALRDHAHALHLQSVELEKIAGAIAPADEDEGKK